MGQNVNGTVIDYEQRSSVSLSVNCIWHGVWLELMLNLDKEYLEMMKNRVIMNVYVLLVVGRSLHGKIDSRFRTCIFRGNHEQAGSLELRRRLIEQWH